MVGFDDSPLIAFTDPPLTTIRKPVTAMGQAAVRALLEEIGGTPAPHSEFVFMPELVVRGSTSGLAGTPKPTLTPVGEISSPGSSRCGPNPTGG